MRWRRRDTAIMTRFLEAMFSLIGEEEAEHIEGVGRFKYLGRLMYLPDENFTLVMPNIGRQGKCGGSSEIYFRGKGCIRKSQISFTGW